MKRHTTKWFIKYVGKSIYRKPIDFCKCEDCQKTEVKVGDEMHARYLKLCQDEMGVEYQSKPIK